MGSLESNDRANPMEWTKVSIRTDEDSATGDLGLEGLKLDLDSDAESMHREFLRGLPHLSEVQERHRGVVSDVSAKPLEGSISTLGEFLSEFGGEWEGSEVRIPLPTSMRDEVLVHTKKEGGRQLVRLISPERFGGILKTFDLPEGTGIAEVFWEGDYLSMRLG
ncbi:MAG: hypothetical protein CMB67_02025 [Euryarchaeota archaeon]|nr:hypothetical protein [Euryarchaeota archaeon]